MDLRNIDKQALACKCRLKVIKEEVVLLWVYFFLSLTFVIYSSLDISFSVGLIFHCTIIDIQIALVMCLPTLKYTDYSFLYSGINAGF